MASQRLTIAALTLGLLCLCAAAAFAQAPQRVPHINDEGQRNYRSYLNQGFHRVYMISEGGGYGGGWNSSSIEEASKTAQRNCERRDPKGSCKPYSVDGYVVWGKDPRSIPRYAEAPKLGAFIPSDYTPVRGPQAAKGVVIWSHGYFRGIDATQGQPHGWVSRFLADGWDIYRYNREWIDQRAMELQVLIESTAAAKAAGYKKVILAGQSHGAWISLESLGKGVKADGVVAAAPARHGSPPSREARQDFIQLLRDARSATIPVVIALFADDSYDPGGRNVDVKSVLGSSNVPLYFIEHPGEIPGHSGSDNLKFNDRFGACILRFASTSPPAAGDCK